MILSTHAQRLERWLGAETVENLSRNMVDWYGPPIPVGGVPGNVWAHKGGDFRGPIASGQFMSALDFGIMRGKRILRNHGRRQRATAHAGFSSLSDLISEATAGAKRREFPFNKAGSTGATFITSSLWRQGNTPPAGAAPANPAAGTAYTDADSFPFTNPTGGDTQHFVSAFVSATVGGNTLLLYDLLFGVNKTMNSTATEAVTGVPTRYQSTTPGAADYIGGNFGFIQVGGTALAATAHNWTVCQYTDQAGTTGINLPSVAGNSGAIVDRLDMATAQWFVPLAAGDNGIKAWTQLQCSAAVATGVIWFMIGHPIAFLPCPITNMVCISDGINTAFNLARVFDDACLAFLEINKPSTSATTYTGSFTTVAG